MGKNGKFNKILHPDQITNIDFSLFPKLHFFANFRAQTKNKLKEVNLKKSITKHARRLLKLKIKNGKVIF